MEALTALYATKTLTGAQDAGYISIPVCLVYGFETTKQALGKPTKTRTTRVFLSPDLRYLCWNSRWKSKEEARVEIRRAGVNKLPNSGDKHWVEVVTTKRSLVFSTSSAAMQSEVQQSLAWLAAHLDAPPNQTQDEYYHRLLKQKLQRDFTLNEAEVAPKKIKEAITIYNSPPMSWHDPDLYANFMVQRLADVPRYVANLKSHKFAVNSWDLNKLVASQLTAMPAWLMSVLAAQEKEQALGMANEEAPPPLTGWLLSRLNSLMPRVVEPELCLSKCMVLSCEVNPPNYLQKIQDYCSQGFVAFVFDLQELRESGSTLKDLITCIKEHRLHSGVHFVTVKGVPTPHECSQLIYETQKQNIAGVLTEFQPYESIPVRQLSDKLTGPINIQTKASSGLFTSILGRQLLSDSLVQYAAQPHPQATSFDRFMIDIPLPEGVVTKVIKSPGTLGPLTENQDSPRPVKPVPPLPPKELDLDMDIFEDKLLPNPSPQTPGIEFDYSYDKSVGNSQDVPQQVKPTQPPKKPLSQDEIVIDVKEFESLGGNFDQIGGDRRTFEKPHRKYFRADDSPRKVRRSVIPEASGYERSNMTSTKFILSDMVKSEGLPEKEAPQFELPSHKMVKWAAVYPQIAWQPGCFNTLMLSKENLQKTWEAKGVSKLGYNRISLLNKLFNSVPENFWTRTADGSTLLEIRADNTKLVPRKLLLHQVNFVVLNPETTAKETLATLIALFCSLATVEEASDPIRFCDRRRASFPKKFAELEAQEDFSKYPWMTGSPHKGIVSLQSISRYWSWMSQTLTMDISYSLKILCGLLLGELFLKPTDKHPSAEEMKQKPGQKPSKSAPKRLPQEFFYPCIEFRLLESDNGVVTPLKSVAVDHESLGHAKCVDFEDRLNYKFMHKKEAFKILCLQVLAHHAPLGNRAPEDGQIAVDRSQALLLHSEPIVVTCLGSGYRTIYLGPQGTSSHLLVHMTIERA